MIYHAKEFGIVPEKEIGSALAEALRKLAGTAGEKTLLFEKGNYYVDSDTCVKRPMFITNTVGDKEWKTDEKPHLNAAAIDLQNARDLTLDGGGCTFTVRGQISNAALSDCENVTLKNFSLRVKNPDMHEFRVVRRGLFTAELELDAESRYVKDGNKFYFEGKDYRVPFFDNMIKAFWIGKTVAKDPETIYRTGHPLMGAIAVRELSKNRFFVRFAYPHTLKCNDRYYLFDVRRKFVGIFAERCKNIAFDNVSQHFNYSLAVVCQDSENIDIKNCKFTPHADDAKNMTSVADFIQICMCRGQVNIQNNVFCASGDDCLNAHGIHFKIMRVVGNAVTVAFCHAQTHGFNPLRTGDTVRFVNPDSLTGDQYAAIEKSELLSETEILLTLTDAGAARVGDVIEDVSACPDLHFSGNTLSRIMTRGLLVTTRGKVVVKNNRFESTSMNSILISDDAKHWYESGSVQDVTIEDNYFGKCPGYNVCVKPENRVFDGYVHHNITVRGNTMTEKGKGIYVKNADNVRIYNNGSMHTKKIKAIQSDIYYFDGEKNEAKN